MKSVRALFAAATLAVVASLAGIGGAAAGDRAPGMRVAVLTFQSGAGTAGDLSSLGTGLQSMVTTDLAEARVLELVERSRLKDIEAEVQLGQSGRVDPKTAARIGRLAGATHLVAGTFTVVGGKMRLDARILSVEGGKVVQAAAVDGDKDAFFDLEKRLVGKLILSLGVDLPPAEKAAVARVHTVDFQAFHTFSRGLELFDRGQIEDALLALREAERRDAGFALAAASIADCERLVRDLRAKAAAIEAAATALAGLTADEQRRAGAQATQMLLAIAAETGAPARPRRLAALYALGGSYSHPQGDRFATARVRDLLWIRYFGEAEAIYPRFPLFPNGRFPAPRAQTFDQDFAALVGNLGGYARTDSYLLRHDLERAGELARRLRLDGRGEADLRPRLIERGARLPHLPSRWRQEQETAWAVNLREIGEYGRSSALLSRIAAGETDPGRLRTIAAEIEKNRRLAAGQDKAPARAELTPLASGSDRYVIIADSPAWLVRLDGGEVATEPRRDPLRAAELRYSGRADGQAVVVLDGVPSGDLDVSFAVSLEPARLTARERRAAGPAAAPVFATVAFAFGIRDVASDQLPLRSLDLTLTAGAVRLVETTQPWTGSWQVAQKILGEQPADLGGRKRLAVAVRLAGGALTATVDGKPFTFRLPVGADTTGFYGFRMAGPGGVTVSDWKKPASSASAPGR